MTTAYLHEALFYGSQDELLEAVVPFVRDGLRRGDAAVLAVADDDAALLAKVLDDPRVEVIPRRLPPPRVPDVLTFLRDMARAEPERRVRIVGELDYGPESAGWTELMRLESLYNRELAPYPLWNLCLYDRRELSSEVLASAVSSHPLVRSADATRENPGYVPVQELLRRLAPGRPDGLQSMPPGLVLDGLRRAADVRLTRDRLRATLAPGSEAFVTAVGEVVTNALQHGRPPVDVRLWTASGRAVCTVTDRGDGFDDPGTGYSARHFAYDSTSALGLRVVRRLCDRVDHARGPDGFTVRLSSSW